MGALSWCRVSVEGTNESTVPDIWSVGLSLFFLPAQAPQYTEVFNPLEQPDTKSADA